MIQVTSADGKTVLILVNSPKKAKEVQDQNLGSTLEVLYAI